jgi:hypothetical protein
VPAPPSGDARQPELLAEHGAAERTEESRERGGFEGGGAELVGEDDAAFLRDLDETGHAEEGVGVEFQRIAVGGVHAAHDRIDALQAAHRAQVHLTVAGGEVGALDERAAEVAGEVGLFEIGLVGRARGEEDHARLLALARTGQGGERLPEGAEVVVEPRNGRLLKHRRRAPGG